MEPVKSPALDPLPRVATYPVADAVACVVIVAVASCLPSRYSVAAWLNDPGVQVNEFAGQTVPGLRVSTAWCHLPSATAPAAAAQVPNMGASSVVLPMVPSRHLGVPEVMFRPIGS